MRERSAPIPRGLAAATTAVVIAVGCSSTAEPPAGAGSGASPTKPNAGTIALTRRVPARVDRVCRALEPRTTLRVVCPRLVPNTPITKNPVLAGSFSAQDVLKPLGAPLDRFYWMSFNSGDIPGRVHWLVARGTPAGVDHWVLSDVENERKGRPKLMRTIRVEGRKVTIYRFPPHPAGGVFGGHEAAVVRSGDLMIVASVHGYRDAAASARMAVDMAS